MKKVFTGLFASLLIVLTFVLSACGNDKNGTYYPSDNEMKVNLEKMGYMVEIFDDLRSSKIDDESFYDNPKGTLLTASKSREIDGTATIEFIYFYRLEDAADCDYYYNAMEEYFEDYNSLVEIKNDEKFGNIVYCGTEDAVNAAGIKEVKVDVKVKV